MTSLTQTINETTFRELRKTFRSPSELFYPLIFFVLVLTMFPFAIPPIAGLFKSIASGILWTAALLAISLSLETLFKADYSSGVLELIHLSGANLVLIAFGKALAHWILSGLPIALLAFPIGWALDLNLLTLLVLVASLLLGSATMSLVGASISALTVGLGGGGFLLVMLTLPFFVPLLIFGSSAAANASLGIVPEAEMYFLGGMFVLSLTLAPWATAHAIRIRLG
jgi:heme exporter protein B